MLRTLRWPADREPVNALLQRLRLSPTALLHGQDEAPIRQMIADVARQGDSALLEQTRRFGDPAFDLRQLRLTPAEIDAARSRVASDRPELLGAIRRAIAQVKAYQQHLLPVPREPLRREGVEITARWTPIDAVGLYVPGGTASYPSSLIMLAVPALVAGVRRVAVCTPGGRNLSDAVLAVAAELHLTEIYRLGGATAVAALAVGTPSVPRVDKILGPGNVYVQTAKRLVSGAVGVDGYAGPSEILVIADRSADPQTVAADLLAQAEHDPGSCFLLTTSPDLAQRVAAEVARQLATLPRREALERSMTGLSAAIVCADDAALYELANAIACEHVSLRVEDLPSALNRLRHAGCIFTGEHAPVAAGDYLAGPSHCLPTSTTARFASGVSVYEFLKRSSVVHYSPAGIAAEADDIVTLARAEGLEAHARSVEMRLPHGR